MENHFQHLTETQHDKLLKLLPKLKELFDGTLGTWKRYSVDFRLKEDSKPIYSRPYLVKKVHKQM